MKTAEDKGVREEYAYFDPAMIDVFHNPRTMDNPGWAPKKMAELREDIRIHGLKQAIEVRLIENKARLLAGERRLRSILGLVEEDAECYDRAARRWDKASKVYAQVKCIITECKNDKEAARASVMENLLHAGLTDFDLLQECKMLEDAGMSRAEQAEVFSISEAWVSQSHSLLKGNRMVLMALKDGTLGRTQALKFLNYEDSKAEAILQRAIAYNQMDFEEKERELLGHQEKVYEKLESQEAGLRAATETGDIGTAGAIRREIGETEKDLDATERKLTKHRKGGKRKPRPSINNIETAAKDEAADGGAVRHIPMKLVKRLADRLTTLLASGEPLENTETKFEYSRREVRIVRDVIECILNRNTMRNPLEALEVMDDEVLAAK